MAYLTVLDSPSTSLPIQLLTITNISRLVRDEIFLSLRILASYEAKIAKICNFWTFSPVIQLKDGLLAELQA